MPRAEVADAEPGGMADDLNVILRHNSKVLRFFGYKSQDVRLVAQFLRRIVRRLTLPSD
jgi:hypothetical protein